MLRTILTYGLISGLVVIVLIIATILAAGDAPHSNPIVGYLIMLVALSSILVAIKQYRDQRQGGVIRFWPALGLGLAIAAVAGLAYVAVWEMYLASTGYAFMDKYVADMLEAKRAAGVTGAEYEKALQDGETMKATYANPVMRLPMTFVEIFPVGALIALAGAALLRNPRFLPARGPAGGPGQPKL